VTGWKRLLRDLVVIGLAVVAYFVVPVVGEFDRNAVVRAAVTVLCIGSVGAIVIWQVQLQVEDPSRRVDGLLLALVLGVLVFALVFYRLQISDPGQIAGLSTRVDSLYFTMSTLLTIGYGDVHAVGQLARVLVLIQMIFNVVVIATAASTLASRVRANAEKRAEARREAHPDDSAHEPRLGHPRRTHRKPT
jgi:hypothetical protein